MSIYEKLFSNDVLYIDTSFSYIMPMIDNAGTCKIHIITHFLHTKTWALQ